MTEGWISCINCNKRFRAFIQFCPNCRSKNPLYNRPPPSKNRFTKAGKKVIVFAAFITIVIISILLVLNVFMKNNGSLSNGLYIENPKSLEIQQQPNIAV